MADALNLAWVYSGLGQNNQVFEWLEWAYQDRNVDLALLKVIAGFEQACSDPPLSIPPAPHGLPALVLLYPPESACPRD